MTAYYTKYNTWSELAPSALTQLNDSQKHQVLHHNLTTRVLHYTNLLTGLPSLDIQVYISSHLRGHRLGGSSELLCLPLVSVA
jgi:hypothetical protein